MDVIYNPFILCCALPCLLCQSHILHRRLLAPAPVMCPVEFIVKHRHFYIVHHQVDLGFGCVLCRILFCFNFWTWRCNHGYALWESLRIKITTWVLTGSSILQLTIGAGPGVRRNGEWRKSINKNKVEYYFFFAQGIFTTTIARVLKIFPSHSTQFVVSCMFVCWLCTEDVTPDLIYVPLSFILA